MRVAVSQFATSSNVEENLATCLRMIDTASACKPAIIVLPEYCNGHSWYEDHNQAWNVALTTDGEFFRAIAEQANKHGCYIVLNVTLRRDSARDHQDGLVKSNISVSSCLFSAQGELVLQTDKQTLVAHELDFFISATQAAKVASTPLGPLGLLTGNDGLSFNVARDLTLSGAQLLCQSLSTFALDQSSLHGPARASENNVFIAAANKIGPLIPSENIGEHSVKYSDKHSVQYATKQCSTSNSLTSNSLTTININQEKYHISVGESQIVSPDGVVLAKMTSSEEGVIFADIDLSNTNPKARPDGTDIITQRRPELYQALQQPYIKQVDDKTDDKAGDEASNIPLTANVALFATYKSNEQAIEDVCYYIENNLSDIIQLPELFFLENKEDTYNDAKLAQIGNLCQSLVTQISAELRPFQYVCTSLVLDGKHQAVIISEHGIIATQQQLHFCERYRWTALGDELTIIELPLEQGNITVAILTGDDANIPEIVKVAALKGIQVLLVPFDIQAECEVRYHLLSRAAENRICIVAATREKSFTNDALVNNALANEAKSNKGSTNKKKVKLPKSTGLITNLSTDFTLFTQWNTRKVDGFINQPLVKYQFGKITKALVHPVAASNKLLTINNDLLKDSSRLFAQGLTKVID
jgi:predicted amidohydrolase